MTATGNHRAPLAGLGIVVTRPAEQSTKLAARLVALGADPLIFPTIAIEPVLDAAGRAAAQQALGGCQWAIFASANAVHCGLVGLDHWPAGVRAAATGPGTAEALLGFGVGEVVIPSGQFDSESLLSLPEFADLRGQRVMVWRGIGGRDLLADTLRARGAEVEFAECYRRVLPPGDGTALLEAEHAGRLQALIVTSSEGVRNLSQLLGADGVAVLAGRPMFVPHPRIAEAAAVEGWHQVVTTGGGDAGLIAGLLGFYQREEK